MGKRTRRTAMEICGAVIGAGFASGREIVVFFTRFGVWRWAAVGAAVLTMACVCRMLMRSREPSAGLFGQHGGIIRGAFVLLMIITGGAMLAGAGEIAALTLPWHGAWWIGVIVTLGLGAACSRNCLTVLPGISTGLIVSLMVILVLGMLLPTNNAALIVPEQTGAITAGKSLLYGISYGGFNIALAAPLICEVGARLTVRQQDRSVVALSAVLGVMLIGYNLLLVKHPLLQGESMPMIRLLRAFGKPGHILGSIALYLAVLTTLLATLSGLRSLCSPCGLMGSILQYAAVAGVAMLGFTGVVDAVYPAAGGICFVLLLACAWKKRKTA